MEALAEGGRLVVTYTGGALTLRPAPAEDAAAAEAAMRARAVTEARVRVGDIRLGDVILHGIDMVLLPPDLEDRLAALDAESAAIVAVAPEPDDFAEQVAATDDGPTVDVVPDETVPVLVPEVVETPDPVDPAPVTEEDDVVAGAGEVEVFVYDPESDMAAAPEDVPVARTDARDQPGDVVTLPATDAPAPRLPEPELAEDVPADMEAVEGDRPAIDLAGETISVVDLVGQPVRDGGGGQLGEVVDVLISLDDAVARTLVYAEESGGLSLDAIGIGEAETVRVDMRDVSVDPVDGSVIVEDAE
jgi:sporulation protein YlmC with PRC-barrel domain